MRASECLSSRSCANPRAPAPNRSRLIEPSLTPTPLSLVVLPCVQIDKRGLAVRYTRFDEVFGWSKQPLKSTYVGFAQTSPDFCKKTPRCPGEFTIASAVSRGVPGRVGLCLWHFSLPHGDRYSGPVGSRRRERDARRPARTASDINLRSFLTLSLRTGL